MYSDKPENDYWNKLLAPNRRVKDVTAAEFMSYQVFRVLAPNKRINPATVVEDAAKLLRPESPIKRSKSKKKKAKNALPVRRTRT